MYAAQLGLGGTGAAPKEGPTAAASASSSRSSAAEASERRDHAAAVAVEAGMIREAQDAEYEASLAADRAKEAALLRAREEQAAAAEAERRAKEAARAEAAAEAATAERRLAEERRRLTELQARLQAAAQPEPEASRAEVCCELAVDVAPLGKRLVRRFLGAAPASAVYDFVRAALAEEALGALGQPEGADSQAAKLTRPGTFKLVQNFAPAPLPDDATTLAAFGTGRRDKFIVRAEA